MTEGAASEEVFRGRAEIGGLNQWLRFRLVALRFRVGSWRKSLWIGPRQFKGRWCGRGAEAPATYTTAPLSLRQ